MTEDSWENQSKAAEPELATPTPTQNVQFAALSGGQQVISANNQVSGPTNTMSLTTMALGNMGMAAGMNEIAQQQLVTCNKL